VVRITVPGVARPTTLPDEPPATTEPADETAPQSAEADAPKSGAEVTAARVRAAAQSGKRTLPEVPPVWVRYPDQELLAELSDGPLLREDPRYLQSVVLEIATKGPLRRRWRLRPGQTATVGRGADAEFIVASDPAMSSVHFAITAEVDCCRIQDRQSRRGTLVNGQPIKSAVLHHRDRIQAGQTEFVVAIRGGRRAPPDMRDRRGADFVLDARPDPALRPTCTAEVCPSGLTVFRGVAPTEQPARVTRLLARAAPLYVLVDFGKAAVPLPADLHERTPLLPASPTSKEDVASPLFVADAEVRDLDAVIAAAWGKDAVVSLLSQQPRPALLDRLQELAHAALPTGERASNGACLGIAWPSLLELLLRHTPADQVGKLLPGVDAYVLEGKSLCPWQIFAREEFSAILAKLGFQPPPNPQPSPGVAVGTDSA
jgi:pSer/pThr/pTyr-binding forkhead associated (FHA) protein